MPDPYAKPHATAVERVAHLRDRGLAIPRPSVAARKIEEIGHERLRIYFLARRDLSRPDKPFRPGTTYKNILRLYECDEKLRDRCFAGVGRFELALRNRISEALSVRFGSHPYFEAAAFADAACHASALQRLLQVFAQSRDERARHYRRTYSDPPLPPIWTMKEFLTFGTSARLYAALSKPIREEIAKDFGVPALPVFESWVPGFVDLRNICAHHDRLFNRRFQKQPQGLRKVGIPMAPPATLKAQLECLDHALRAVGEDMNLVTSVRGIVMRHPEMSLAEVGY